MGASLLFSKKSITRCAYLAMLKIFILLIPRYSPTEAYLAIYHAYKDNIENSKTRTSDDHYLVVCMLVYMKNDIIRTGLIALSIASTTIN